MGQNVEILGFNSRRCTTILVVCLVFLPVLLMVSRMYRNSALVLIGGYSNANVLEVEVQKVIESDVESRNDTSQSSSVPDDIDKLLNGLLAPGFDEEACLSRYQSSLYRRASPHKPSPYLLLKLRKYEDLHRCCGPYTKSYNKTLKGLKSSHVSSTRCKYIVWTPANGLGNRMVSMASTFLYALLTDRVLLVGLETDMADLFCEPFPNTSWLLPVDFPLKRQFGSSDKRYAHSLGSMLKNNITNTSKEYSPSFVYLNLGHNENDLDQHFSCDQSQALLQKIPWLILLSDQYFAPAFFMIPSFKQEASKLFPEKETIFHHLGTYLFHPSNPAWGLITRFYDGYLAKMDETIGIQIRLFTANATPFQVVLNQILACMINKKLLPQVEPETKEVVLSPSRNSSSKAILITSLDSAYYKNISNMYWTNPTATGEVVGVFQPSHEEYQHFGDNMHNMKAWAEIYILSLTDVLVTSAWSTFGYVAQGLGGLKPWILRRPGHGRITDPPCQQAISMEPCFHFPPKYDCQGNTKIVASSHLPYTRPCEDKRKGVKLVNDHVEL